MAHDVIKRVGRRAYRYRVESFRDPETKRVRSRWTYAGVVSGEAEGAQTTVAPRIGKDPAARAGETRERLLGAFLELIEDRPFATVTAGMIAARAGLAHGTFYRYFADKRSVFLAALARVREDFDRAGPSLAVPCGDRSAERARVRAWVAVKLSPQAPYAGIKRAFFEALKDDPELQAMRVRRGAERTAEFASYLERLNAAGITEIADCAALSAALRALIDGAMREPDAYGVESATVAGVVEVFDRAIFMASRGSICATETRELSSISKYPT